MMRNGRIGWAAVALAAALAAAPPLTGQIVDARPPATRAQEAPGDRFPVAFGMGGGIGAGEAAFEFPRNANEMHFGPYLSVRIRGEAWSVPLVLLVDYQLFRVQGAPPAPEFRALYLLGLVEIPFERGWLRVGGGPVFYQFDDPPGMNPPGSSGWAAGAVATRSVTDRLHLEAGYRAGRAANVRSQLLTLGLVHYWGL